MILAGDIGGTNTRLSLFQDDLKPIKGSLTKYPSGQHKSLEEILEVYRSEFLPKLKLKRISISKAGFGVAGPVREGRVKTTNLPWQLDAKVLAKQVKVKHVALVNDLYATAAGVEVLPKSAFTLLRKGKHPKGGGTQAIIAPGTGLGHASLVWTGKTHIINPAEAGHIEFGATSKLEDELRQWIASRNDPANGFFGRCSYENILSGPGLRNLYDFLVDTQRYPAHDLVTQADPKDRAGVISQCGLSGQQVTCTKALEMFVQIFGRQAGNFAMSVLAQDGIFLGGGIPPKILPALKKPEFLAALSDKGSQTWVGDLPVSVITDDLCALYGAANCATMI